MGALIEKKLKYYKLARNAYESNQNIVHTLMQHGAGKSESIELAYELQAGEYTRNFNDLNLKRNIELHEVINRFTRMKDVNSIAVFGVGEARNWIGYEGIVQTFFGIDLSYSRLRFAYDNLAKCQGINTVHLIKGDATQEIFQKNSVDLSITMHSIEPNGNDQGVLMLQNAIKSSAKYTLLFEPDFSTAHDDMKKRMIHHDYVQGIDDYISTINTIKVHEKYVLEVQENKDNLTTCWVIEKRIKQPSTNNLVCPISGCCLTDLPDFLYSQEAGLAYPKLGNFVCLNKDDAVFIGKADQFATTVLKEPDLPH